MQEKAPELRPETATAFGELENVNLFARKFYMLDNISEHDLRFGTCTSLMRLPLSKFYTESNLLKDQLQR